MCRFLDATPAPSLTASAASEQPPRRKTRAGISGVTAAALSRGATLNVQFAAKFVSSFKALFGGPEEEEAGRGAGGAGGGGARLGPRGVFGSEGEFRRKCAELDEQLRKVGGSWQQRSSGWHGQLERACRDGCSAAKRQH